MAGAVVGGQVPLGVGGSSFRFSSPSFGSRMVRYKIATAATMIIETMKNSGR